jgi:cation diffusion facilitator family transporter
LVRDRLELRAAVNDECDRLQLAIWTDEEFDKVDGSRGLPHRVRKWVNYGEVKYTRQRLTVISASLLVSILLLGVKFYAYLLTQSSAILSDALESIINVVASGFALWSIYLAAKPPDPNHPYGHGKIEYFSAGFEGALIILAAISIVYEAAPRVWHPSELLHLGQGLLVLAGTSLVNLILGLALIRTGRRTQSITLMADGKHILTDVFTTLGVLVGLGLVYLTGWYWLDGLIACIVAVNILVTGWKLVRTAFGGLMNETDPRLLEEISGILSKHRKDHWIDVHKLRAWRSGDRIHLDFHLIMPRDLTLDEGHHEVKLLENVLQEHFQVPADILIHVDPCTNGECPICGHSPCVLRGEPTLHQRLWHRDQVTADNESVENRVPLLGDGCKT